MNGKGVNMAEGPVGGEFKVTSFVGPKGESTLGEFAAKPGEMGKLPKMGEVLRGEVPLTVEQRDFLEKMLDWQLGQDKQGADSVVVTFSKDGLEAVATPDLAKEWRPTAGDVIGYMEMRLAAEGDNRPIDRTAMEGYLRDKYGAEGTTAKGMFVDEVVNGENVLVISNGDLAGKMNFLSENSDYKDGIVVTQKAIEDAQAEYAQKAVEEGKPAVVAEAAQAGETGGLQGGGQEVGVAVATQSGAEVPAGPKETDQLKLPDNAGLLGAAGLTVGALAAAVGVLVAAGRHAGRYDRGSTSRGGRR